MHQFAQCAHPRLMSLVTGDLRVSYCSTQRDFDTDTMCGAEARFFEESKTSHELLGTEAA